MARKQQSSTPLGQIPEKSSQLNRGNTMNLEESVTNPNRLPEHVVGLTEFLRTQYYRYYGIHTTE